LLFSEKEAWWGRGDLNPGSTGDIPRKSHFLDATYRIPRGLDLNLPHSGDISRFPSQTPLFFLCVFTEEVMLGDIVSCEPTKASFRSYGGIGVRYGTDGYWAYTTSLGNAVKIILRKGKPFVFSSNNPEKICSIINQMKNAS